MSYDDKINELKIKLPEAKPPVGNYVATKVSGKMLFISGQIPIADGNILFTGKVNKDLEISSAVKAAELCMLNSFAITAFKKVPILFVTCPEFVTLSAPTIHKSICFLCINNPAALSTIITGLIVSYLSAYMLEAMSFGLLTNGAAPKSIAIGIGMWLGIIMAYNVWFVIWPNQKIALGLVDSSPDEKAKSAKTAMLFSRVNTLLSFPMLLSMVAAQNLY